MGPCEALSKIYIFFLISWAFFFNKLHTVYDAYSLQYNTPKKND